MHSVLPGTATSSLHCGKAPRCYTSTWPPPPPPSLLLRSPSVLYCTVLTCTLHLCALCLVCCQHKTTFTQNLHSYKLSFHSVFYKFELRQELNGMGIFQENLTTTSTTIKVRVKKYRLNHLGTLWFHSFAPFNICLPSHSAQTADYMQMGGASLFVCYILLGLGILFLVSKLKLEGHCAHKYLFHMCFP